MCGSEALAPPRRLRVSPPSMLIAWTSTITPLGRSSGSGTSSYWRTSGGPVLWYTAAFMAARLTRAFVRMLASERDHPVVLGEQAGDLRRCRPPSVDAGQRVLDAPTGRRAGLSDVDRYLEVADLAEQLGESRYTHALGRVDRAGCEILGAIARHDDGDLIAVRVGSVDREMDRQRRLGRISRAGSQHVDDSHSFHLSRHLNCRASKPQSREASNVPDISERTNGTPIVLFLCVHNARSSKPPTSW